MGFLDKILRSIPGTPTRVAKTMVNDFNSYRKANLQGPKEDAYRYTIENRYKDLHTMNHQEIESCLESCSDLGEIVFWAIAKENPSAAKQPSVRDTVGDLYEFFSTTAPEESNGLKEMIHLVLAGMDINPFR